MPVQSIHQRWMLEHGTLESRFGETTLPIKNPHGFQLVLVETGNAQQFLPWETIPVSQDLEILLKIENRISFVEEILVASRLSIVGEIEIFIKPLRNQER